MNIQGVGSCGKRDSRGGSFGLLSIGKIQFTISRVRLLQLLIKGSNSSLIQGGQVDPIKKVGAVLSI